MKKYIYAALVMIAPVLFASCDDDDTVIVTSPAATGIVTDDEGNEYGWIRIGNLDWTTSNALNGSPLADKKYYDGYSWSYVVDEDDIDYIEQEYVPMYGNLMSYEEALESAPDGWRLPTDEDWKSLERALGMGDADNKGWRGSNGVGTRLMDFSSALGFNAMLPGGAIYRKENGLNRMQLLIQNTLEYGYFWTATAEPAYEDVSMAYYRKLVHGQPGVERQCGNTVNLMSVRWCRNATND